MSPKSEMIYLTEENNFLFNQCHHNKLLLHLESALEMHLFLYLLVFLSVLLVCVFDCAVGIYDT